MPRQNNPSIKCISLDVDKAAYEYLIGRGYSIRELFSKMLYSLMEIERDSEIRYENSKKAFEEMIRKDREEKEAAERDARAAAELAERERENKLYHILPLFRFILKRNEGRMSLCDEELLDRMRRLYLDVIREYPDYKDVSINRKWVTAVRKYYSQNDVYNPDTITKEINDILL